MSLTSTIKRLRSEVEKILDTPEDNWEDLEGPGWNCTQVENPRLERLADLTNNFREGRLFESLEKCLGTLGKTKHWQLTHAIEDLCEDREGLSRLAERALERTVFSDHLSEDEKSALAESFLLGALTTGLSEKKVASHLATLAENSSVSNALIAGAQDELVVGLVSDVQRSLGEAQRQGGEYEEAVQEVFSQKGVNLHPVTALRVVNALDGVRDQFVKDLALSLMKKRTLLPEPTALGAEHLQKAFDAFESNLQGRLYETLAAHSPLQPSRSRIFPCLRNVPEGFHRNPKVNLLELGEQARDFRTVEVLATMLSKYSSGAFGKVGIAIPGSVTQSFYQADLCVGKQLYKVASTHENSGDRSAQAGAITRGREFESHGAVIPQHLDIENPLQWTRQFSRIPGVTFDPLATRAGRRQMRQLQRDLPKLTRHENENVRLKALLVAVLLEAEPPKAKDVLSVVHELGKSIFSEPDEMRMRGYSQPEPRICSETRPELEKAWSTGLVQVWEDLGVISFASNGSRVILPEARSSVKHQESFAAQQDFRGPADAIQQELSAPYRGQPAQRLMEAKVRAVVRDPVERGKAFSRALSNNEVFHQLPPQFNDYLCERVFSLFAPHSPSQQVGAPLGIVHFMQAVYRSEGIEAPSLDETRRKALELKDAFRIELFRQVLSHVSERDRAGVSRAGSPRSQASAQWLGSRGGDNRRCQQVSPEILRSRSDWAEGYIDLLGRRDGLNRGNERRQFGILIKNSIDDPAISDRLFDSAFKSSGVPSIVVARCDRDTREMFLSIGPYLGNSQSRAFPQLIQRLGEHHQAAGLAMPDHTELSKAVVSIARKLNEEIRQLVEQKLKEIPVEAIGNRTFWRHSKGGISSYDNLSSGIPAHKARGTLAEQRVETILRIYTDPSTVRGLMVCPMGSKADRMMHADILVNGEAFDIKSGWTALIDSVNKRDSSLTNGIPSGRLTVRELFAHADAMNAAVSERAFYFGDGESLRKFRFPKQVLCFTKAPLSCVPHLESTMRVVINPFANWEGRQRISSLAQDLELRKDQDPKYRDLNKTVQSELSKLPGLSNQHETRDSSAEREAGLAILQAVYNFGRKEFGLRNFNLLRNYSTPHASRASLSRSTTIETLETRETLEAKYGEPLVTILDDLGVLSFSQNGGEVIVPEVPGLANPK